MRTLNDYEGRKIRLTDERLAHILEHQEMMGIESGIAETLERPESVIRSASDNEARLYHRLYPDTLVGEKPLCVVVKAKEDDAFVLTAYLTDKLKRGEVLWRAEER
jgi:hypothetical protein